MRGIDRNSAPASVDLTSYQQTSSTWNDLAGCLTPRAKQDYIALCEHLRYVFGGLCAYCERLVKGVSGQIGPVDHFRPRNPTSGPHQSVFGADLTFELLNLMFACPECQDSKSNKWPGTLEPGAEAQIDSQLTQAAADNNWSFTPVSAEEGYVNPNLNTGAPAQDYFEYNESDCSISPAQNVSNKERSKALRTIHDIALGDPGIALAGC